MGFEAVDRFLTQDLGDTSSDSIFIETDQLWEGEGLEPGSRQRLYDVLSENDYSHALVLVQGDPYEFDLTGFEKADYRVDPDGEITRVDPAEDMIDEIEAFYSEKYGKL